MQTIRLTTQLDRHSVSNDFSPYLKQDIQLDLGAVSQVDTAGLAWILRLIALSEQKGLKLTLLSVPEQLITLAKINHVVKMLPMSN